MRGQRSVEQEAPKPGQQQMAGRMGDTVSLTVLSIGGFHQLFKGLRRWLSRSEHLSHNHKDLSLNPSRHVERWAMGVCVYLKVPCC